MDGQSYLISSHLKSTCQISHTTFQLIPLVHIYLFGFEVGYAAIMYLRNFVYIWDLRHPFFSLVNLPLERSTPLDSLLYYFI